MPEEPDLARLTDKEREVLRLVYRHRTSKEIARTLAIAKPTVDQRVDTARAKLGGVSRKDAARLLAEHEAGGTPDPIPYDPIDISEAVPWQQARPWPTDSRPTNELSAGQRVAMIGGIALLGLMAVAVLLALMVGVGALVGR